MAAHLLRLGRLCSLKADSLGFLGNRPALWFCTRAEEPTKPVKKTKAAGKKAAAAAAPPEPEEPFDNSTYQNLQHHNYNPYTFADLDVEMAKFRLPQPSSGKPSPRH
ncbi:NADH dehydrogenase [ubiquinone] flavoprotein 3, mitochondrial isoform X2 [Leuresthes tenuis]|uniref:NADH dehydrogenase [ubiquinone] flavoprotein 3, mitochondrial isoform X2 n=1 Tax=Leuresthes tenuis TaxID=355514 RepID=UPI003B50D578